MERKILIEVTPEEYEKIKVGVLDKKIELKDFDLEEKIISVVDSIEKETTRSRIDNPVSMTKRDIYVTRGRYAWISDRDTKIEFEFTLEETFGL